jgi:hypothetical protein
VDEDKLVATKEECRGATGERLKVEDFAVANCARGKLTFASKPLDNLGLRLVGKVLPNGIPLRKQVDKAKLAHVAS